jgi:TrmH family RNA methyltransferase
MAIRIVNSKQNPRVKELRAALLRPGRGDAEIVALEGFHLVSEAVRSRVAMETVFVAQGNEKLLQELGIPDSVEVLVVPREILDSALSTESPQPIAALAMPRSWTWEDLFPKPPFRPLVVVLAGVQDPGNLGTILRSAEAFGASGVVCLPGTVSPWNPKALRASAGSIFRLPLIWAKADRCLDTLHGAGIQTLAAMAHDAQPLGEVDLSNPIALVIGAEGSGLAPELAAKCKARITIPCPGPVESLNAAVAASVLLYEASRQRAIQKAIQKDSQKPRRRS